MKREQLEKYLGKKVKVTIFDGDESIESWFIGKDIKKRGKLWIYKANW